MNKEEIIQELTEALTACHDSMLMSHKDMTHLRSFKKAVKILDKLKGHVEVFNPVTHL